MGPTGYIERSPEQLARELRNFEEIARGLVPRPGSVPTIDGIDVYGDVLPLNGLVGGDHLIYMDFKKRYDLDARIEIAREAGREDVVQNLERCRRMAGICLIDVSGHQVTDAVLAAMFHQAFLLGALYELDMYGQITRRLFENLNTRFHRSSKVNKFITAIHGEISEEARFRFLSAAHPIPVVFSAENDRFMDVNPDQYTSFPPLGTLPSKHVVDRTRSTSVLGFKDKYVVNEWSLMGGGDILILYTDGLADHSSNGERYFPGRLEDAVRRSKHLSATEIVNTLFDDLRSFADPVDDVSIVVIKKV